MRKVRTLAERFWDKVDRSGECWNWTAHHNKGGYGRFNLGKNQIESAHRVSWELAFGPIPEGMCVLHRCDNRSCVRPDHLFLGDRADNVRDMAQKGRARAPQGDAHWTRRHPERVLRGEANGAHIHRDRVLRGDDHPFRRHPEKAPRGSRNRHAKLTEAQVKEIRDRHAQGGVTAAQLAAEHGVHEWSVYAIIQRRTWRHVA